jgi:hypothetical protein
MNPRPVLDERAIELAAAYERIDELTAALRGMVGFFRLISHEYDGCDELREQFNSNHRIVAAQDALADMVAS